MTRILLIEDDGDIALSLKHNLEKEGSFRVTTVPNGEDGLQQAIDRPPDLVLLDLNLPGMEGFDVCRELRRNQHTSGIPIIMITARVDEADKVAGLELGADDYITKPFSIREVVARVRALLRRQTRAEARDSGPIESGSIRLDEPTRRVEVAGREVTLTRKEFDLLAALMQAQGRVLTREHLLQKVWGYTYSGETRTVDVHVRKLRKKLGEEVRDVIETVVGIGYRFRGDA